MELTAELPKGKLPKKRGSNMFMWVLCVGIIIALENCSKLLKHRSTKEEHHRCLKWLHLGLNRTKRAKDGRIQSYREARKVFLASWQSAHCRAFLQVAWKSSIWGRITRWLSKCSQGVCSASQILQNHKGESWVKSWKI